MLTVLVLSITHRSCIHYTELNLLTWTVKKYDPKISFISFESLKEKVFDRRVGRMENLIEFVENSHC